VNAKDYRISLPIVERDEDIAEEVAPVGISEEITGKLTLPEGQFDSPKAIKELDQVEPNASEVSEVAGAQGDALDEEADQHNQWLSIDNENYEYESTLRISLLPRKLKIYHGR